MQKRQKCCKRNNLRAGEGKQLTVARTKQQEEEEEDTSLRPVGGGNKVIEGEKKATAQNEQSKQDNK